MNTNTIATAGWFGRVDNRLLSIMTFGWFGETKPVNRPRFWQVEQYENPSYLYEVNWGLAPDAYPLDFTLFGIFSRMIHVNVRDHAVVIQFTYDGVNPTGRERVFEAGQFLIEAARGFRVRNETAGQNGRFQIFPME